MFDCCIDLKINVMGMEILFMILMRLFCMIFFMGGWYTEI